MEKLLAALSAQGFAVTPVFTGQYLRFDRGKTLNGWFIGWEYKVNGASHYEANYGDWATGEKFNWASNSGQGLTQEELSEQTAARAAAQEKINAEKIARQEEAATLAWKIWESAAPASPMHSYLLHKQISPGLAREKDGSLILPIYSMAGGTLTSLQFIDGTGTKRFLPGGKLKGGYCALSSANTDETPPEIPGKHPENTLYLAEGFATGMSVHMATGASVYIAFNANNLVDVAQGFAIKLTQVRPEDRPHIVVAADNDHKTEGNPGLTFAKKAASALQGAGINTYVVFPEFKEDETGTDFNDAACAYGPPHIKKLFEQASKLHGAQKSEQAEEPTGIDEAPKKDKPKKKVRSEKEIALWLLEKMRGRLVRQDDILFLYDSRRWVEMTSADIDVLKNNLNHSMGDTLASKDVNSIYRTFFRYIERVPKEVNLFVPNPHMTNFLDGTLHLRRDLKTNSYTTEFMSHNPKDFLMWVIPVNYTVDRELKNDLFEKLLDEAFAGDQDKAAKVNSLAELAGAMLVPAFPQMFFLTGVSGSRKSTIAKTLLKVFQKGGWENVSFVDPALMENFQIEGMIGKLVNANTDIDDETPMKRGFLKRFEDDLPFQVNRKGKPVVNSVLPKVHLYCCNDLPPNTEKSKALLRRVTVIDFKNDLTNDNRAEEIKFYEDVIYAHGPGAILAFALNGLDRLLANGGKFSTPASSLANVQQWLDKYNATAQFLEAVQCGEVGEKGAKLELNNTCKISKTRLGEIFMNWRGSAPSSTKNMVLGEFYADLNRRRFEFCMSHGERFVRGFKIEGVDENSHGF